MNSGGLDAENKVNELERDGSIRTILCNSTSWLETVITGKLQNVNELAKKQICLSHMKLQNQTLRPTDLLKLDSLLSSVTDESIKGEGGAQLLFLLANLPEIDERRRNILLLQSLTKATIQKSSDIRYTIQVFLIISYIN